MQFVKKAISAKPTLQVVKDPEEGQQQTDPSQLKVASSFLHFMEAFIDHHPQPKQFAESLLHVFQNDNEHGHHLLTLNTYARAEFDAVGKFLTATKKEIETMFNKDKQRRKKGK